MGDSMSIGGKLRPFDRPRSLHDDAVVKELRPIGERARGHDQLIQLRDRALEEHHMKAAGVRRHRAVYQSKIFGNATRRIRPGGSQRLGGRFAHAPDVPR